ncbi:MAG: zinc metalloprotease HtpX [Candidatus Altiarchaeota archaeon]
MRTMFEQVRANKRDSWILMFGFIVVIGVLGSILGLAWGNVNVGLVIAVTISIVYGLIAYYSGGALILKLSGAREVTKKEYPYLFHTIEGLAIAAGVPTPKAYVIEDSALNAFATGRDPKHAAITVTTGLLKVMDRQELEGVIAHEMSHISNFDIRFMMLTTVMVGIVTLLSDFLLRTFLWGGHGGRRKQSQGGGGIQIAFIVIGILFAILAPLIGQMIKFAISRQREYLADANAAVLTRYPPGLAGALDKIRQDPDPLVDTANKATAHLYISTPFRDTKSYVAGLFSTHPPIDERIKRLQKM